MLKEAILKLDYISFLARYQRQEDKQIKILGIYLYPNKETPVTLFPWQERVIKTKLEKFWGIQ